MRDRDLATLQKYLVRGQREIDASGAEYFNVEYFKVGDTIHICPPPRFPRDAFVFSAPRAELRCYIEE